MNQENKDTWVCTFTGIKFHPLDPKMSEIDIRDIAHALSLQNRYNGHTAEFYSVAEHSLMVSELGGSAERALLGLLHDASEAYLGDIIAPLKQTGLFKEFGTYDGNLQRMIYAKFCRFVITEEMLEHVHKNDQRALCTEVHKLNCIFPKPDQRSMFSDYPVPSIVADITKRVPMSPKEAEQKFLDRFWYLVGSIALDRPVSYDAARSMVEIQRPPIAPYPTAKVEWKGITEVPANQQRRKLQTEYSADEFEKFKYEGTNRKDTLIYSNECYSEIRVKLRSNIGIVHLCRDCSLFVSASKTMPDQTEKTKGECGVQNCSNPASWIAVITFTDEETKR